MIVAIDGPAGSGKSTIAHRVAQDLGFFKLDTGALYRSVAYCCQERGIDLQDEASVVDLARKLDIRFDPSDEVTRIWADGEDVSQQIRTPEVDRVVSIVAAYAGVREAMLPAQRQVARDHDVVAEGRDIGTVVFPNADLKVFLTADPRERARRRVLQRHANDGATPEEIEAEVDQTLADLERRDKLDSSRETAPLRAAEDAVHIDSSAHTIDEVVAKVCGLIEERR